MGLGFWIILGFELLGKFWQACAKKCEPFASLRQKRAAKLESFVKFLV